MSSARERSTTRVRRPLAALGLAALGLASVLVLAGAGAAAAQDEPVPDPAATPAPAVDDTAVIDTAVPDAAPTTAAAPSTSAPPLQDRVVESEDATRRLNLVVIGLLGLAGLIALATVVFWRLTRPARLEQMPRPAMHWMETLPDHEQPAVPTAAPALVGVGAVGSPDPSAWAPAPTAADPWAPPPSEVPAAPPFTAAPVVRRRRSAARPGDTAVPDEQDHQADAVVGDDGPEPDREGGPDVSVEELAAGADERVPPRPPIPTPRPDERTILLPRRPRSSRASAGPGRRDGGPTVIVEEAGPASERS